MKSSKGWVKYVSASLAVAIVALPFASVGAQQSPGDAPTPVIRIKTRLVTVDVVVTDKWGKPVAGLHPEDFAVEENGRKQKVVVFATPEEANKPEAPMPTLGPGIYTNRPEFRVTGGPPTVLLLDAANTAFKDQAYARLQMLKYVQDATAGRRIAIFTLTNGLHMLQDFTSDPKALQDILQHYKPQEQEMGKTPAAPLSTLAGGDGGTRDASAGAIAMAQSIRGFQDEQVGYVLDRRVQTTLEAMRSLARILGGIPGRKNIIWLTAAFPFSLIPEDRAVSQAELDPYMQGTKQVGLSARAASAAAGAERGFHADAIRDASAQLASAQVAIYPVDVRG